jgi:hypothetical protein
MNKLILAGAGLAALAALPAFAQPAPAPAPAPGAWRDHGARPLTRAEAVAKAEARFARADANRDGFVTPEEASARREAARPAGEPRDPRGDAFARLDANRDGQLSREEFEARGAMRGPRGEGFRGHGRHGGFGGRGLERLDADHDGRVSLAEARAKALEAFDRADANRDGVVTPEERHAAREAMRARFQARRAG